MWARFPVRNLAVWLLSPHIAEMVVEFIRPRNRERRHHEIQLEMGMFGAATSNRLALSTLASCKVGWASFFFFFSLLWCRLLLQVGFLLRCERGYSHLRASHGGGFFCCTAQAPGLQERYAGFVAPWDVERIFPDRGLNYAPYTARGISTSTGPPGKSFWAFFSDSNV